MGMALRRISKMLISKFSNSNIEDKVADLEKRYGIILPVQYKKFLYKYNGGYTPRTGFEIRKIESDLRGFYGIGDVDLSIEEVKLEEWLEKSFFPIACDSFGNYIVIGLGNDNSGKIYFCDHEKGFKAGYMAENLQEFIKCCKSDKIKEASKRSIKEREEILIANGRGDIITDGLRQLWQAEIDKYGNMIQEEVVL